MSDDRRSIDELVTRYTYHPELRDLYVEGSKDKSLLAFFLRTQPRNQAVVYDVGVVDVPEAAVTALGLTTGGNQMRLVAFSLKLDLLLPPDCKSVLCCVDKDFSDYDSQLQENRFLLFTDFSCLECYAIAEKPLERFCAIYLGFRLTPSDILATADVLSFVFATRFAKRMYAQNAAWFNDFTAFCKVDAKEVLTLDRDAYASRVIQTTGWKISREQIFETAEFVATACDDKRQAVHGHDLIEVICWLARKKGVSSDVCNKASLHRSLLMSAADDKHLHNYDLFRRLASWAVGS